jgi:hypothetical protein
MEAVMKNTIWAFCSLALITSGAGAAAAGGGPLSSEPAIVIAPAYETVLRSIYGEPEGPVLRTIVGERVSAALRARDCGGASQLEITLLDARPTHPTDKQIDDNPAIDRLRTHYLGGASFTARFLAADGNELKSLRYDRYAETDRLGSKAAEPWADVRLASEALGAQLARACAKLSREVDRSP